MSLDDLIVTDMKKSLDGFKDDISKSIESVTGLGSQVKQCSGAFFMGNILILFIRKQ